ncbi:hypothetical protein [Alicyclobacillus sp. SP_1]|uniref:hypothetical protein n=1 Tax=Alicyclobacillus sp. SP_1 TaxID=2942475 RepID=UPI0021587983|nr:hypothetical protein [Alicyclobacillus sp. SP_1]
MRYKQWLTAGVAMSVVGGLAGCGSTGNDTSLSANVTNAATVSNSLGGQVQSSHNTTVTNFKLMNPTNIPTNTTIINGSIGNSSVADRESNPADKSPSWHPNMPTNESMVSQTLSNNGDLKIVEYQSENSGMPPSGNGYVLYKANGTWQQLYHTKMGEGTFAEPMWFQIGNVNYAVLAENVSPGDWSGETMQIVRLTQEGRGWSTKLVVNRDVNNAIVLGVNYRDGNSLLIQKSHVLGASPSIYSFFDNKVNLTQVSIDYPNKIPNSKLYTLHVKVKSNTKSTTVNLSGSTQPLSLKAGQTLVVRETGDAYPIYVSATAASNRYSNKDLRKDFEERMSPYRKAILFKAVHPFNGYLSFYVHFAGPNDVGQTGISSVPLEVK